jgi:hypothetical protein
MGPAQRQRLGVDFVGRLVSDAVTDEAFFTDEEMDAFREADRLRAFEQGEERSERLRRQSKEPERPRSAPVTARNWDDWNAWAAGHVKTGVDAALQEFAGVMGEEVAAIENKIRADLRNEFEVKLGELRAEMNVLRGIDHGTVVGLPGTMKGWRDAA